MSLAAALSGPLIVLAITTERAVEPAVPRPSPPAREVLDAAPPEQAQGLRGTVVGPHGSPLSGARVSLQPSAGVFGDHELPAVAAVTTDRHGAFALGVANRDTEVLSDLLVDSDSFATFRVARLRVFADRWLDVGPIALSAGATIKGRVVARETDAPIVGAELQLAHWPVTLGSTSFRTVARTGADGAFAIASVRPEAGFLGAYAAGFASQVIAVDPTAGAPVEFALDRGCPLRGVVVDERGQRVAGAAVNTPELSPSLLGNPRSDASGGFVVFGLGYGRTTLVVQAPGYARWSKEVTAPADALRVELRSLGWARLRVRGADGQLLSDYRFTPRTWHAASQSLFTTDAPALRADLDDAGTTLVNGLDQGSYVLEVEARGHAKTFSEPFDVVLGTAAPLIEVRMETGGSIRGAVNDGDDRPLAGATVTAGQFGRSRGLPDFLRSAVERASQARTVTDAHGLFHLPFLSPGTYDLEIRHPDHAEVRRKLVDLRAGEQICLRYARLVTGAVVSGRILVNGEGRALAKVTVSGSVCEFDSWRYWFYAEAWTDRDGHFDLPRRVPPGEFEVRAERHSATARTRDWRSKTELTIAPAQTQARVELKIDD